MKKKALKEFLKRHNLSIKICKENKSGSKGWSAKLINNNVFDIKPIWAIHPKISTVMLLAEYLKNLHNAEYQEMLRGLGFTGNVNFSKKHTLQDVMKEARNSVDEWPAALRSDDCKR